MFSSGCFHMFLTPKIAMGGGGGNKRKERERVEGGGLILLLQSFICFSGRTVSNKVI